MNEENDFIEIDETECIKFILNYLPAEISKTLTDDDIQYVLDLICDYYESQDLLEEDTVAEAEIAEEDMFNYISAIIKKEKVSNISDEVLAAILDGEFEYGKEIGIYTESED